MFTSENAKEYGKKGGLVASDKRKKKKQIKELLEIALNSNYSTNDIEEKKFFEETGEEETQLLHIIYNLIKATDKRDYSSIKATELILKTLEEQQKTDVSKVYLFNAEPEEEQLEEIKENDVVIINDLPR